jgi:PAS domain S-box-containing protein
LRLVYSMLLLIFSIIIMAEMTGIYFLYEFKNSLENQITMDSEKSNRMMVNRIDSYATERLVDLINLAKSTTIETIIQASDTQFSNMTDPQQYMDKMDSVWTSVPQNETAPFMETMVNSRPSEQLRQLEDSENTLFHGKVYENILMTNAYGVNVIQSDKTPDYKQSEEIWWQEARKNGVYLGQEESDEANGTTTYTIAYRMDDENGNFIGVAMEVVNIQQIINIIKNQMNVTSSISPIEYELIRPDGTIIYSTNSTEKPSLFTYEPEYSGNLNDFSGHFTYVDDNQKYLVTYSHSPSSKISSLFNWIFITKYKSSDILEPVVKLTDYLTTIMILVVVSVSITVFAIAKKLTRPIEKLQEGIISFSRGARVKIKPEGMTELHSLIEHVNQMTETISNSQDIVSRSEEKFRMLFELSPIAIVMADEKGIFTSVNRRFLETFGYDHDDEIIGKAVPTTIAERSRQQFEEFYSKTTDKVVSEKNWFIKKDKTEFPGLVSAQKIYDQNKKMIGIIGAIKDISDIEKISDKMKNDEMKLERSENLYRALFELSPDPIRISTIDRITMDVNESFLRKFEYSRDEMVGKPIYETISENSRADIEKIFDTLRNKDNVENIEIIYHKKNGTEVPVLLSVSKLQDQLGNIIGQIAIIKDISEIYNARIKIKEEEEVILNQYLKIKQIEEQKDQFASMISHELTTPLFPIKFQTEMLKDSKILGKLNEEQIDAIDDIHKNAILLEKLISDILDAQKLELGKMKFIKTDFELKQFMKQMTDNSKTIIGNKVIEFENSTKDQITLTSDPDRLTEVFSNLIKNSADFVAENTGKIEIGAQVQGNDILFHVKDNGIGIPKNKQMNLFRKFYQIDTSMKRSHRGSGLGLSICKGIIEGLGGKIWLESTEGLGTIVYFTIPKGDNE